MRLTSSIWWEEVAQKLYGTLFCPDKYLTHRIQQLIPKLRILNFQKNQPIRLFLTNNKTSWSKIYLLCNSQILLELPTTYYVFFVDALTEIWCWKFQGIKLNWTKQTFCDYSHLQSSCHKKTYWSNQRLMILIDPSLHKSLNLGLW